MSVIGTGRDHACIPDGKYRDLLAFAGGVSRRSLAGGMQSLEKRHQRGGFGGIQVLSVGGHVAAALDYLADQLILA